MSWLCLQSRHGKSLSLQRWPQVFSCNHADIRSLVCLTNERLDREKVRHRDRPSLCLVNRRDDAEMAARTLLDLLTTSTEWLTSKGIENARRETEWLFAHVLQCERLDLYLRFDMPMDEADVTALRGAVARRGPLLYT